MKRCLALAFALLLLPDWALSADPIVTLVQENSSVKVLIGEDVFTVYYHGTDRRKPFFLPVTGPGGFELLKQAVATERPDGLGRKVVVASQAVTLEGTTGAPATVRFGDVLEIGKIEANRLWVTGKEGWISRTDIAPLAAVVTRMINDDPAPTKDRYSTDKYDHPHHKGLWFAVDEINEIKFWMEASLIRTQSVHIEKSGGPVAEMTIVNHWLDKEDRPIFVETTKVSFDVNRLLTYDAVLTPAIDEIHIGDTKEGMFAIRLPGSMHEKGGKGVVTSSNGLQTSKNAWGKTASWVNYDGPVDGHLFGVTLLDSAQNPWPSRYHVRDYGLFAVNPFGAGAYTDKTDDPQPKHERVLKKGESLHFKFGAWIHGPEVTPEQIQTVYNRFSN